MDSDRRRGYAMRERLAALGHEVEHASTHRAVRAALQPGVTPLVLVALDRLGCEAQARLRRRPPLQDVRTVMYADAALREGLDQHALLPVRADAYLVLPVAQAELEATLARVLASPPRPPPPSRALDALVDRVRLAGSAAVLGALALELAIPAWHAVARGLAFGGLVVFSGMEAISWIRGAPFGRARQIFLALVVGYLVMELVSRSMAG